VIKLSSYQVIKLSSYQVIKLSSYQVIKLSSYQVIKLSSYQVIISKSLITTRQIVYLNPKYNKGKHKMQKAVIPVTITILGGIITVTLGVEYTVAIGLVVATLAFNI
ncbi:hypothetical protein, partial [Thiothrix subterranea]